jgi:hypothetical protein
MKTMMTPSVPQGDGPFPATAAALCLPCHILPVKSSNLNAKSCDMCAAL